MLFGLFLGNLLYRFDAYIPILVSFPLTRFLLYVALYLTDIKHMPGATKIESGRIQSLIGLKPDGTFISLFYLQFG